MENGFFIVRQSDGTYALCHRYETVPGDYQIPGMSMTAAELCDKQQLKGAFATSRKQTFVATMTVEPQNADN